MAEYFYLEIVIQFCTQCFFSLILTLNITLLLFKVSLRKCTSLEDRVSAIARQPKNREYFLIRFYKHTLERP